MYIGFKKKLNYLYNLFLFFYLILGFYFAINTGISTDEFIDQYNWSLSFEVIKKFIFNIGDDKFEILNYEWRFHGIGFHYVSQIYLYIIDKIINFENFNDDVSQILMNHGLIFLTFFLSGIYSKKILNLIIKDHEASKVFLVFYLLFPYLLGHGFYNPKDMPFLFLWILSTYLCLKIFIKIFIDKKINYTSIFLLSLSTAFLFSIRISGILIIMQYLIILLITINLSKRSFFEFIKLYFGKILLFSLLTLFFTFIFYPILWINPYFIVDAINQMRNIPYGVCTLTLGECMDSLDLPSTYILIWLFFKLPIICLFGLILFPFVERKIFLDDKLKIILGSLIISLMSIIFLLIFFKVNLYDELRHILFIIPLILIISFSIIYFFSRKITIYLTFISILFFSVQNINMYPYQYTWFNAFSNFVDINKKFELDYWGVSGRNLAKKINNNQLLLKNNKNCIYVAPIHIFKPFVDSQFNCVKSFFSIYPKSTEKYILVKYTRNIRRENPSNCKLVFDESYKLFLTTQKLTMGETYICN